MLVPRGRPLLGPSGRAWASGLLAGCAILVGLLGVLFAGQTRADGFDRAVDTSFIAFFAGHRDLLPWLAKPGTPIPAILISAVIAAGCLLAGRLNGAVLALTAVPAADGLTDGLLKPLFDRTYLGALVFPSGHTTAVVALAATLAVLLLVPPQRSSTRVARVLLVAIFWVTSALVATAVIALRWHYFTDTVAGAAVGVGTVCALALILDLVWDRASRHRRLPERPASVRRVQGFTALGGSRPASPIVDAWEVNASQSQTRWLPPRCERPPRGLPGFSPHGPWAHRCRGR